MSRLAGTSASFVLCEIYLGIFPPGAWGIVVLIGMSAAAISIIGRPGDGVIAGITTAVLMVIALIEPNHAWRQPILRLADTIAGAGVGVAAAWIARRSAGLRDAAEPAATRRSLYSSPSRD